MSVVDGVESVRPERGRHDYSFLLQDEAILNGEFLAEVPIVVQCFGAFLAGRRPPFIYHSRCLLNVVSLAVSLRVFWRFIGDAGRFLVIWWMSNCGNCPSGGAGCGDTLERASAMGTSAPLTHFTVTSYFRARITNLCNLGGQLLSFFLKIASSGL